LVISIEYYDARNNEHKVGEFIGDCMCGFWCYRSMAFFRRSRI